MNKEIEESIKILNSIKEEDFAWYIDKNITEERIKAIKTISNYIENSISKEKIEEKLEKMQSQYKEELEKIV